MRRAHRDESRIVSARGLSLRMFRMRAAGPRRASPEGLVAEEEAAGVRNVSGARPGQRSESRALDVVSKLDHSIDSCFLVSTRCLLHANGQGSPVSGPGVRRSRYRRADRPLDRRLCVATFRWFCLCQKSRGAEDASLCQPPGVMDLSLSSNGHAASQGKYFSNCRVNPISPECVKSSAYRLAGMHSLATSENALLYICVTCSCRRTNMISFS